MAEVRMETRKLSVFYGAFEAIQSVDMAMENHRVTALIGPSGCGKSTFLRALNRMNDIIPGTKTRGKIFIDGENIYFSRTDVVALRKKVGMVFQKSNPFPKSVFDNVAYGPRIHGERNKKRLFEIVERSLQQAGLWEEVKDRLTDSALDLSGGQQQRLCIARALAVDPEILLMDEPTSALDPKATARVENLIEELVKRYTIIIVTHNIQQAARVSDYTAFLYEGKLIEFGETTRLFTKPACKQTEGYITGRFG